MLRAEKPKEDIALAVDCCLYYVVLAAMYFVAEHIDEMLTGLLNRSRQASRASSHYGRLPAGCVQLAADLPLLTGSSVEVPLGNQPVPER